MMLENLKHSIKETLKLLWQFKWYAVVYLIFYVLIIWDYLNPPTADDMIFRAEETSNQWDYANQEAYLISAKFNLINYFLIFLIATSNMRNHPILAKLIFLFPIWLLLF